MWRPRPRGLPGQLDLGRIGVDPGLHSSAPDRRWAQRLRRRHQDVRWTLVAGVRRLARGVGMERADMDGGADRGHSARTRYRRRHALRPFLSDADSLVSDGRLSPEFDVGAPVPVGHLELGWIVVEPAFALDLAAAFGR